jgi:uncharacterized coiled-coil protein SlyX
MTYSLIQIKYSLVTAVPTSLAQGELAYSQLSGKLYIGNDTGLPVEIGGADLVARVGSVETAVGLLQTDLAAAQTAITGLTATNATQDTAIAALQASVAALEASQDQDLADAVAALTTQITSLTNSLAATQGEVDALETSVATSVSTLTSSIASTQAEVDSLETALATEISDRQAADAALQTTINGINAAVDAVETSVTDLAQEVDGIDTRVASIESDIAGQLTLNDVTITGDLVVQGTLTRVDSTVETIEDPVITIGSGTQAVQDAMDRGVEFKYFDSVSGTVKTGFFGMDHTTGRFTFIKDASNPSDNRFTGAAGEVEFGTVFSKNLEAIGNNTAITGFALIEGTSDSQGNPTSVLNNFVIHGGTF